MVDHPTAMARVGKYLMLDLLGEGAFGKVRLAVDETTGYEYAMKIMKKSDIKAHELTLQVRREIAVMKAMRHPNIVNLHEVLTSSNNLYMVMDLVTGGELFQAVAEEGRIPEDLTRSYFQQLVDAVHYCHSRRVYHRDLKPENLLLSADKQTLKITDFGLSSIKAQNASSELLHTIMGSPHYIAPEIITAAADGYDGAKVDVWASGVILFGMLAGYLPFDEPSTRALYKSVLQDAVKYPPHFSYDVIKLLKAMLEKDPDKRPTMEQVKTFPWFIVNYRPAVTTEENPKSPNKSERRKLRHKLRKHGERVSKKKKDKGGDSHSRTDAFKHGRRKREIADVDVVDESTLASKSSVVVEVSTNLSDGLPSIGEMNSGSDADRHTKENVDPAKQLVDKTTSPDTKSTEPTRSFSDRSDPSRGGRGSNNAKLFSKPSNHLKSFGKSSSKSAEDSGRIIDPGRSFTMLSNVARSFTKSRFRNSSSSSQLFTKQPSQSSFERKESATTLDKVDSSASRFDSSTSISRVASFSSQPSITQTDISHDAEGPIVTPCRSGAKTPDLQSVAASTTSDIQNALTSQSSSQEVADSSGKEPEASDKGIQVTRLSLDKVKDSERNTNEGDSSTPLETSKARSSSNEFEPVSLTAFVSPISESSRASFASIAHKRKTPRKIAKQHCPQMTNVASPISRQEIQTPRAVVPNLDDDSCVASMRGFDDGTTPVSSCVDSAIFKPMTGLLESLIQQTPKANKESMSPSVLCPEVEGDDVADTSEWGIDSLVVFADVEAAEKTEVAPEGAELEVASMQESKQEATATTPRSQDRLQRMDSSSFSIIDAAKPIFGPLSQELELKLTPSMEAEAAGTAAMKNLSCTRTIT